jgi:N-acetyl-gamma-glutamyl-phosphate reductase
MTGLGGPPGRLVYLDTDELAERADEAAFDVVFLATPSSASEVLAPTWLQRGVRVIDLSDAYRADEQAVYGLTEHARDELPGARLVANPGCYPTAVQLALIPLTRAGLLADGPVIVDAKSGATGAGRRLDDALLFNELADNHYPYKVGVHRHVPEMERGLGRPVLFTPHLLPTRRGLLISAYVGVAEGVGAAALRACLADAYAGEPFVEVVEADAELGIGWVSHTPLCRVAVAPAIKSGVARVFGSLDNLLKGAASQAVQNLNAVMGLDETMGLST